MKTRNTALNAVFSAISLLISSVLSLIATKTVLSYLGSDYNGLNSTITQFLSVLMLIESGLTVAALVKLYKPYGEKNMDEANRILSKANSILIKVGILMAIVGTLIASLYAIFIKTELEYFVILLLFVFSILTTSFNFAYTYKYRLLFQVSQTEYIIYVVNIFTYIAMYVGMILLIIYTHNIVIARLYYSLCNILSGFVIGFIAKKKFPLAKFNVECKDTKIEGTKELFVSKLVGLLYNSLTVFFLSVTSGTLLTSVYSVYKSVISIVSNYVNVLFSAPRNALGQVINHEKKRLREILEEYEYIVIVVVSILFTTTLGLIIPFVRLYTSDVTDVNYIVPSIAFLIVITSVLQMLHIPSGQCIELSGLFNISKKFQIVAVIVLIVLSSIGVWKWGLMGLLIAKLITSAILAVLEICFTHIKIVPKSILMFIKLSLPHIAISSILVIIQYNLMFNMKINFIQFIIAGFCLVIINTAVILLFDFIFYRKNLKKAYNRFFMLVKKR